MSEKVWREPLSIEINRQRLYLKGKMRNYTSRGGELSPGRSRAPPRSRHRSHTGCLKQRQRGGCRKDGRNVSAETSDHMQAASAPFIAEGTGSLTGPPAPFAEMVISWDLKSDCLFEFQLHHLPAARPWTSHLTFLCTQLPHL